MNSRLLKRTAQHTAEYAILIALVLASIIAIRVYVTRGVQAKLRDGVDSSIEEIVGDETTQYEPYYITSEYTTTTNIANTESETLGSAWDRTYGGTGSSTSGEVINTLPEDD